MELIQLLLDPKVLGVLTPAGVLLTILSVALYKLAKKYDDLQEKRIHEWQQMNKEYTDLANDINKTLDLVVRLSAKKNGNGNGQGTC